jgi:chorismate mutase
MADRTTDERTGDGRPDRPSAGGRAGDGRAIGGRASDAGASDRRAHDARANDARANDGRANHPRASAGRSAEPREIVRIRRRIDALDRRIVALMNQRAELGRDVGRAKTAAGRRAVRDVDREREVLLRVTMANDGPIPQADLLAIYRRLIAVTRSLERRDRG